jgi:hypothetical protein
LERISRLNVVGGAVISGSFQAFDQSCSSMSWSGSVPPSWASPKWLDAASALREVMRLPERERKIVLGIVRQFGEMSG